MTVDLGVLRRAGVLSALDEHFARVMARIGHEDRAEVVLAAALVSRHVAHGHVCLDLARLIAGPALFDDAGVSIDTAAWPSLDAWMAALRSSALVGEGTAATPLVLDPRGRLYLRRYWQHQEQLVDAIRARAVECNTSIDASWLRPVLDRLFPSKRVVSAEPDWQRIAACVALQRRFCVISGGPGTGKTFTVVKLLALLIEYAVQVGARVPRVTLLAPTGKAAARLAEAIGRAKTSLPCVESIKAAIPSDVATIHRCLSPVRGSGTRFRHDAENPLYTDVVLVDEASMVDLGLMTRLVAALPTHARLILLGDKDQLASVEAGAVLGDICNTGYARHYSRGFVDRLAALSGEHLRAPPDAPRETGIWDCIVQLTHSYRYGADSRIDALARAVNAGDSAAALEMLDGQNQTDVARLEPAARPRISESLRHTVVEGFRPYPFEPNPAQRLRTFDRFRVLCAHRRGPDGVEAVNRHIEAALVDAGVLEEVGPVYVNRPIMITQNDYQNELFNGDVGLLLDDPETAGRIVACFATPDGRLRRFSPARLPPHETVFAMSIHKSQGSEFDEVVVLLPEKISPVVSRELLYTAVTRARQRVTIHASRAVIEQAIARRIERASGLRELLWPPDWLAGTTRVE